MTTISPRVVCKKLDLLDRVDPDKSAAYRELAQDTLGDPSVSLKWRQAIADRLNHANHLLALSIDNDDSY